MLLLLFALFALLLAFDGRCRLEQLVIRHQVIVRGIEHVADVVGVRRENLGRAHGRIWRHSDTRTHLFSHLLDLRRGLQRIRRTVVSICLQL